VSDGVRRHNYKGQIQFAELTLLVALHNIFAEVDGHRLKGRQIYIAVNSEEGVYLPLAAELGAERVDVHKLRLHRVNNIYDLIILLAEHTILAEREQRANYYRSHRNLV
jgi:hypothetical protein